MIDIPQPGLTHSLPQVYAVARPWRASLPIYALPEMAADNDAFWQALRSELGREGIAGVPDALTPDQRSVPQCIEPSILFTQLCGYPLQTLFRGQAIILGAPAYDVRHCDGPSHAGLFIVRKEAPYRRLADLRGRRFAFNSRHSNSGMNLPRRAIAEITGGAPFFGAVSETGAHVLSLQSVLSGAADATCVDNVTYAFWRRGRPALAADLRVLAVTPPSPAIPFITAVATEPAVVAALRQALTRVARAPCWAAVRAALFLGDILPIEASAYVRLLDYEREATALGYPDLA
jgi:ABC-type phosphate/phosphonate transport system substrate-binding protein